VFKSLCLVLECFTLFFKLHDFIDSITCLGSPLPDFDDQDQT
jgi:hypothetical protein